MKDVRIKAIFSMKLAGYLMQHGFVLIEMRENENKSGKNVFYFNDSPELEKILAQYKRK